MIRVLFVCTGNICRSPTAEGVFRDLIAQHGLEGEVETDSAGTHDYHVGEAPDSRSRAAARVRGIYIGGQSARQARRADFETFDYVLAMDRQNLGELRRIAPKGTDAMLALFLDFAPDAGVHDVPDPYYGGADGFEEVLDLVEAASRGLLAHIRKTSL